MMYDFSISSFHRIEANCEEFRIDNGATSSLSYSLVTLRKYVVLKIFKSITLHQNVSGGAIGEK